MILALVLVLLNPFTPRLYTDHISANLPGESVTARVQFMGHACAVDFDIEYNQNTLHYTGFDIYNLHGATCGPITEGITCSYAPQERHFYDVILAWLYFDVYGDSEINITNVRINERDWCPAAPEDLYIYNGFVYADWYS